MTETLLWGERIAALIIDEEMRLFGHVRLDGKKLTGERIAAYLAEPELQARFLADASAIVGEPVADLGDAFLALKPIDYIIASELCEEGFRVKLPKAGGLQH